MKQRYQTSVFYEDTDCMGVVYHASYVRFLERGRTELLDSLGPSAAQWLAQDVMFPVFQVELTFRAPARLRDCLEVRTDVHAGSPYRLSFRQRILKQPEETLLVVGRAEVVCTDRNWNLRQLPASLLAGLGPCSGPPGDGCRT